MRPSEATRCRRLRHFLTPGDVGDFVRVGAAVTTAPLALSLFGLRPLLARMAQRTGGPGRRARETPGAILSRGRRLALYADFWLRRLRPRNPCLRRSLLLFGRLRRAGLPVTFCLGVRTDGPQGTGSPIAGHAWLELDGRVILESPAVAERHTATFRYPAEPRPRAKETAAPAAA
jgi:hypothetical protein